MRLCDKRKSRDQARESPLKKKEKERPPFCHKDFFLQFAPKAKECRTGIVVFFPLQMQLYTCMHQKFLLTVLFPGYLEMQLFFLFFFVPGFEIISCAIRVRSSFLSFSWEQGTES